MAKRIATACLGALLIAGGPLPAYAVCHTDTSAAELAAGSGCYVGDTTGGEVLLAPTAGSELDGPTLPAGWGVKDWPGDGSTSNGTATFALGTLSLDGLATWDPIDFTAGHSMELVATFGAATHQHAGFAAYSNVTNAPFDETPYAIFSTRNSTTQLEARVHDGSGEAYVILSCPGGCIGVEHRFRIDWMPSATEFYVDGVLVFSDTRPLAGTMRMALSDLDGGGPTFEVDWVRVTPYATPCTYESAVLDSGASSTDWLDASAATVLPVATGVTVYTRTGGTPIVDGSWSTYQPVTGTAIASPRDRYLQYRLDLATADVHQTPEVESVQVCYAPCSPAAEMCDGIDNDCDGLVDEGDPGGGGACDTGNPGICAAGIEHCLSGSLQCVQTSSPQAETCNGLDDNCNGTIDEGDPGGGSGCDTGNPGICAAGIEHCVSGSLQCVQTHSPQAETCNGLDDNCNGAVDEGDPGGGGACSTGNPGICAAGIEHCVSGSLECVQTHSPQAETCNGLDDNCNGAVDEGDPGGGGACSTGNPGICAAGIEHCVSGALSCVQTSTPQAETCNNLDDDCNGAVDDGNPGGGAACDTGQPGICADGTISCVGGSLICQPDLSYAIETCNGLDDNCNGEVDEGNPEGGAACDTGLLGVCAAGTTQCQSPTLLCVQNVLASAEVCASLADENCDGEIDEEPCELCTPANTVEHASQTKVSVIKIAAGKGKVVTKGTFVLPAPGVMDASAGTVTVRLEDANGVAYQATVPSGGFTANGSGRTFKFSDTSSPFENGGLQKANIKINGGDRITTKYLFKAKDLDLQAFAGGTGSVTVRVGNRCFRDPADACTVVSSGKKAKCQ